MDSRLSGKPIFLQVGEWMEGFHEVKLYGRYAPRLALLKEGQTGQDSLLSEEDSQSLWEQVVTLQTALVEF